MSPKKTGRRRSRKETLQEDLTKLFDEENTNDDEVFPILKEALNEGVNVNLVVANRSFICYFAFYGMLKCFEECFLLEADPTIVTSEVPIDALVSAVEGFASTETSLRMVRFLLNHVKFNDLKQNEAVERACDTCRFEVVRLLLRRNNSLANNVLWWGVYRRSSRLMKIAIEFNASVNQRQSDGRHLVHMAAELQDSSILQQLLDTGADIEFKNKAGETAFEVAVRWNNVSCVRLLIDRKCEFSIENALLLAVQCRSHDVLSELLRTEDFRRVVREKSTRMLLRAVARDDLTAFKIMYPISTISVGVIQRLVRLGEYDMLSATLFEFPHPGLSIQLLTQLIDEASNDDVRGLLQKKIDAMNGVDLVAKVKKEAEEEKEEQLESTSKTKKTSKTKRKNEKN